MKSAVRFAASAFCCTVPLFAAIIDVTNAPDAYVHPGAGVAVDFGFSLGGCLPAAYGESSYPTEIRFSILGPALPSFATVTDSSAQYAPGYLFQGWLESADGSQSVPLVDPDALRMGLPEGMLLVSPGTATVGGAPVSVSVIDGFVYLAPAFSEALGGSARIRIVNRGEGFTIGLGDLLPVRSSVLTAGVASGGSLTTGGVTNTVEVMNPEPGTWLMVAGGVIFLLTSGLKRRVKKS